MLASRCCNVGRLGFPRIPSEDFLFGSAGVQWRRERFRPVLASLRPRRMNIGSNSIHMVVARVDADGHFTLLDRAKEMVRLGKGTLAARVLSREAMQAGMQVLATFKRLADTQQIDRIVAVATSAVREAKNGDNPVIIAEKDFELICG